MVFCQALTLGRFRCGKDATDQSYFWYYDQHQRVNRTFHLCQNHSNKIINSLIEKEIGYKQLIDKLYSKIEHTRSQINHSPNYSEQRDMIRQALENGNPKPKFKSVEKLQSDIKEYFRKIKVYKDLLNNERNRTCRYENCRYPLKEPNEQEDQIGNKFSHADFHSGHGYRREIILFHTECGISWLLGNMLLIDKELKYIRPQRVNQGVLEL